jgi:hypothetical protein
LLVKEVTKQREVFRGRRVGRGSYFSLFLIFILLLIISRGFGFGGSYFPLFIVGTISLPPHHILRQGDPPRGTVSIPRILYKNTYTLRKQKLT